MHCFKIRGPNIEMLPTPLCKHVKFKGTMTRWPEHYNYNYHIQLLCDMCEHVQYIITRNVMVEDQTLLICVT